MKLRVKLLLFMILFVSVLVYAKPPYVEVYYDKYPGERCHDIAKAAFSKSGFNLKGGTWGRYDIVAYKDDFKAVISCVDGASPITVFIVAGPDYKKANEYSLLIRQNFGR